MQFDPESTRERIVGALYTAMGIATTAGLDHGVLGGFYLIIGLTYCVMSRR